MQQNPIIALGYVGVRCDPPDAWDGYAEQLLGLQKVDRGGDCRAFRMDDRTQRLIVDRGDPGLDFIGWEVAGPDALDTLAARLDAAGYAVTAGTRALADRRHVVDLVFFSDPDGNRIELFHGQHNAGIPFQPARPTGGFVTETLGMGHVVLSTADVARMRAFYAEVLGFAVSDYACAPMPLCFLHVNARHHSFALLQTGQRGVHHLMMEYAAFDDLGRSYDMALSEEGRISQTLGRHTNDFMTSFYTHTPSGFFVESGFGGRLIDPETWTAHETNCGPSIWGHDRLYLDEETRERYRKQRMLLAREGFRAPNCPWLDATLSEILSGPCQKNLA